MEWKFFDIELSTINLFSFMLGMSWAFFNQGLFGKRIGMWIFLYFAGLAMWYALSFYAQKEALEKIKTQQESTKIEQKAPAPKQDIPDPNEAYFKRQG